MRRWLESDDRASILHELLDVVERDTEYQGLGSDLKIPAHPPGPDAELQRNLLGELLRAEGDAEGVDADAAPAAVYKSTALTIGGLFLVSWPIDAHLSPVLHAHFTSLPTIVFFLTAPTVFANTYFGAPLMFFFFHGWLKRPSKNKTPGPITSVLVAGFQGRGRKLAFLALYFAVLLTIAFS